MRVYFTLLIAFLPFIARGYENVLEGKETSTLLGSIFSYDSLFVVFLSTLGILFVTLIILLKKPEGEKAKVIFFIILLSFILGGTTYITGDTFYKISLSPAKSPVHWHADFRIFNCGEELDLVDPRVLSNRIGTPVIHEHGDFRIHVEGLITDLKEASLAGFFEVIGGSLTQNEFKVPTNDRIVEMKNGNSCPSDAYQIGEKQIGRALQVFVWTTKGWRSEEGAVATQRKLGNDFPQYVMSPEELVPPADCVIFEFGAEKNKTEYVCEQYEVAEKRGELRIER